MDGEIRVRNWRACKRVFFSRREAGMSCFETSTRSEWACSGSLTLLPKAAAPREIVPAFFLLAGFMRRSISGGWYSAATGEPSLVGEREFLDSWNVLRANIGATYRLRLMTPDEVESRFGRVGDTLGWAADPDRPEHLRIVLHESGGFLNLDGVRSQQDVLSTALDRQWLGGLSVADAWNDQLFVGESATQFALVSWATSA